MTEKKNKGIGIITLLVLIPFGLCASFLLLLGKCLGLSYKQISVIFNLHLQGGLLLLSGALPFLAICWNLANSPSWLLVLAAFFALSYLSIYIVGFIWLVKHYHLPMEYAFDLCVSDLKWVATKWHRSYHAVNLIIFVLWWLSFVGMNVFTAYSIYRG
jgi:hypothetical protein